MKSIIYTCMIAVIIMTIGCAGSPEAKVYTHTVARFTVTCPAGWSLISEDSEMYEFRKGDVKLIEVGGFDFGMTTDDFEDMSGDEYKDFLRDACLGGFEGYCSEAEIDDYTIDEQYHTTWGGMQAYRIHANGFSGAAEVDMVIDLIAAVNLDTGMLYMLASQIAKDQYAGTKVDLESAMSSFQPN